MVDGATGPDDCHRGARRTLSPSAFACPITTAGGREADRRRRSGGPGRRARHARLPPDHRPGHPAIRRGRRHQGDHTGFPNDVLWPDMQTFRRLPWDPASVSSWRRHAAGTVPSYPSRPGPSCSGRPNGWPGRGLSAWVATELEFYVYEDSYPQSFRKGYRVLSPLYHRCGDNDVPGDRVPRPVPAATAPGHGRGWPASRDYAGRGRCGPGGDQFPTRCPGCGRRRPCSFKHAAKAIAYQRSAR